MTELDEARALIGALASECERAARFIRSYDGKPAELRAWATRCETSAALGHSPVCTPAAVLERAAAEARRQLGAQTSA